MNQKIRGFVNTTARLRRAIRMAISMLLSSFRQSFETLAGLVLGPAILIRDVPVLKRFALWAGAKSTAGPNFITYTAPAPLASL